MSIYIEIHEIVINKINKIEIKIEIEVNIELNTKHQLKYLKRIIETSKGNKIGNGMQL